MSSLNSAMPQEQQAVAKLERVLVVDDDELTRDILRSQLGMAAASVDEASDGWAALALFEQRRYDAVLLDNQMPGLDGCQTVKAMRSWEDAHRLARTLVLVITSSDLPGDERRILDAGATAYLVKPIKNRELMSALGCRYSVEAAPHPMARLLPRFFCHVDEMLGEIEAGKDRDIVAKRLHQLRGMVAVYGFVDFAGELKQLETRVQQGEMPAHAVFEPLRASLRSLAASVQP